MKTLLLFISLAAHAQNLLPKEQLKTWVSQAEKKNPERLEKLRALFLEAGCASREQKVRGSKLPNLICEIPGPDDAIIVVGAHYDKVTNSDGVIDNWTGSALLPALYHVLKSMPHQHKILFIGFAEEEKGLVGSQDYVRLIPKADRSKYRAMVNIDSIGASPLKTWPRRAHPRLLSLLDRLPLAIPVQVGLVNLDQVGMGDSFPFHDKKIPSIDFHSLDNATWPLLHSPRDNAEALHFEDYWTSYRVIATYVAFLDQQLAKPASDEPR